MTLHLPAKSTHHRTILDFFHESEDGRTLPALLRDRKVMSGSVMTSMVETLIRDGYLRTAPRNLIKTTLELRALYKQEAAEAQVPTFREFKPMKPGRISSLGTRAGSNDHLKWHSKFV